MSIPSFLSIVSQSLPFTLSLDFLSQVEISEEMRRLLSSHSLFLTRPTFPSPLLSSLYCMHGGLRSRGNREWEWTEGEKERESSCANEGKEIWRFRSSVRCVNHLNRLNQSIFPQLSSSFRFFKNKFLCPVHFSSGIPWGYLFPGWDIVRRRALLPYFLAG